MECRADVVHESRKGQLGGATTAADRLVRFVDGDGAPPARKLDRRREPVGPRTDDDRVGAHARRRCWSNQSSARRSASMRFSVVRKPCPSPGYTWYSCGFPPSRSAFTTCSASPRGTRGSFSPWRTSRGARIFEAWVSGERSRYRSASFAGSPSSRSRYSRRSPRVVSTVVLHETTPTTDTPAAKRSGRSASDMSVRYPP